MEKPLIRSDLYTADEVLATGTAAEAVLSSTPQTDSAIGQEPVGFLRRAGYWLHLVRAVEETGLRLYKQGRVPGSFYDGRGQEATAVGVALAVGERDVACPLIRDMGVHLVRGVPVSVILRHYLGKAGAPSEGADGNIHFGSLDHGTLPMVSHLPEMIPVGMGAALARCWKGEESVAVCFCGDGAANGGVWHESMNLAAVWRVPLVVVIERNGWAYMTPSGSMLALDHLVERASAYGGHGLSVDGNDVRAVYAEAARALEVARAERRPVILEAWTYRMHGHGAHDGQRYVPSEELDRWAVRDPLRLWREQAEATAGWSAGDQERLERLIKREVDASLEDALGAPFPASELLAKRVFADAESAASAFENPRLPEGRPHALPYGETHGEPVLAVRDEQISPEFGL